MFPCPPIFQRTDTRFPYSPLFRSRWRADDRRSGAWAARPRGGMSAPIVSVIMAAYNGAALLPETLASLQAQTFGDFELIVVDDRSPDDTLALLHGWSDHRIHVIAAAENQGPVKARNRAFAQARGRYIAALAQDDICLPDRFARQ